MEQSTTSSEAREKATFIAVFLATIVVQGAHMAEHVAQVIQKVVLHRAHAHGLIGRFDLEWVHFIYNLALLLSIYYLFFACGQYLRDRDNKLNKVFLATMAVQSYHMLEHAAKIMQHLHTGKQGTPGLLGNFTDIIWFHFWMNGAVLTLVTASFFALGLHKKAWGLVQAFALNRNS